MRAIIMQPGSKTMGAPTPNAVVCPILEGEMQIDQDGRVFTAKKTFAGPATKTQRKQAFNDSNAVAIMRMA